MSNFSIISFNFNGYDVFRTHFISSKLEYLYVTDWANSPEGWKHVYFSKGDPWYNCLYVRYHPFEFTDSDYAMVIDSSLSSNSNIEELATTFVDSECDIGVLLSQEPTLKDRIIRWVKNRRINEEENLFLSNMLRDIANDGYRGTIAGAVRIYRNTAKTQEYLDKCWSLLSYGSSFVRLDEVPSTLALELVDDLKIIPFSTHLIQGDVFQYYHHREEKEYKLSFRKTKFWLKNERIDPVFIGSCYHRTYKYKTEIMCLTRYLDPVGLREWLDHHFALGFDHIHIFDNESSYDCKSICEEYGDRVSYDCIYGYARHYKIYDEYINSERCKAEWIFGIDDDEYLELNSKLCSNIQECIKWYKSRFPEDHMFAIRWKHLFPKKFHSDPDGKILDYCTEENSALASRFQPMGDRGVKTIVHRIGNIHYEEAEENPSGGHVPVHPLCNGARLANGELVTKCSCRKTPEEEPARLIHCRYKGYTWYKNKYLNQSSENFCYGNCSAKPYLKKYKFSEILESLD